MMLIEELSQPTPAPAPAAVPQEPKPALFSEIEKLRSELTGILEISFTAEEAENWVKQSFGGKTLKDLTKAELKAAVSKINAELDAREMGI
jgi:hypothetical protein